MILKQDAIAWELGNSAGKHGALGTTCPFPPTSDLGWSWFSGWIEGAAERNRERHIEPIRGEGTSANSAPVTHSNPEDKR